MSVLKIKDNKNEESLIILFSEKKHRNAERFFYNHSFAIFNSKLEHRKYLIDTLFTC